MFKKLFARYMEQAGDGSTGGAGAAGSNTTDAGAPNAAEGSAPAGTAPAAGGDASAANTGETAPGADGKAAGTEAGDGKNADGTDKAPTAPEGAPEKYEFTLPEGQSLNPDVQAQFEATARELNLPQDAAQKLVATMAPKIAAAQAAAFEQVQTEWVAKAKADPELGGDKFDANLAVAKKAMDRFASPDFKTYLNETGLGNHPEMLRMLFKAGQALSEDKFVPGNQGNAKARDAAKTLYPSSN